jgi:RNA polymerase sigma-70 factor (ECF subfamily)
MSRAAANASGHYRLPEDDVVLSKLIRAGDTRALDALIRKHSDRVTIIVYRIIESCGTMQDAEDLAQEVFIRAWSEIDKYDPSRGSIAKWINVLAKYTALGFRREVRKRLRLLEALQAQPRPMREDPSVQALANIESEQRWHLLEAALEELSEAKRQSITLRYLEGKSYKEIAELTDCPVGTVKSRISRGVREIQSLIALDSRN